MGLGTANQSDFYSKICLWNRLPGLCPTYYHPLYYFICFQLIFCVYLSLSTNPSSFSYCLAFSFILSLSLCSFSFHLFILLYLNLSFPFHVWCLLYFRFAFLYLKLFQLCLIYPLLNNFFNLIIFLLELSFQLP